MSSVVGVDIGFQNSVIAAAGRGGVDVILNGNSNRLNPTMVGFDDSRKMGEYAIATATSNFERTVKAIKRLIGLPFDDPRAVREMRDLPLKFEPYAHANGTPTIGIKVELGGQENLVSAEAVLGMMIRHMGEIAAQKARAADTSIPLATLFPQDWVIGIPNYYTDSQRRAVLTACDIAGIGGVQRLMHESTATALAYGIFKDLRKEFTVDSPSNVMFIDMGASSYTVSVAVFEPGKLTVKSAYSDSQLGGRDFDDVIAQFIATDFATKFKGKLSADPMSKPKTRLKLLDAAEKAKKTLSPAGITEARISLEMLQDDLDYHGQLLATDYERICKPLLDRLAAPIHAALAEAKLASKDLAAVELVGGSLRIGCVKRKLIEILGMQLSTTMNADESIARGCALQSAILSPRFKVLPYEIVEAQPYPIKVAWDDDKASGMEIDEAGAGQSTDSVVMFDRGIAIPIIRRVTLRRNGDFKVKAMYDDSAATFGYPVGAGKDIAEFSIKMKANEEHKVRVNVKADLNGIIQLISAQMIEEVEAEEKAGEEKEGEEKKKKITKVNLDTSTSRPIEWSDAEVKVANEMEVAMANTDRIVRETAEMQNELESYIYNMRDKICSDSHLGPYGTEEEKSNFVAKSEATQNWLYEDAWDATKSMFAEKLAELKQIGGPIESRMTEALGRDGALKTLQSTLQLYQNWVNESQTNESYSHITDEEREKVRSVTEEVSSWMYEMMDKQGSLAVNQEPVLKIAALVQKTKDLKTSCDPTMRKPKPAPKKEEPPKPEEKKPENAEETKDATMEDAVKPDAPEGNGENAAMDVDPK